MIDETTTLCDRVSLGIEFQPKEQLCSWITAIGTAVGLGAGTAATVGGAAILGAGLGGITANITSLANGTFPWSDPGQFFKASALGLGTGAAGGALGGAIGPALGAAADGLGLSSNVGTVAAEAGAPSGAASLSGQVPAAGLSLLTDAGGTSAPQGLLSQAIGKLTDAVGPYAAKGGEQAASQAAGQVGGEAAQVASKASAPWLSSTLGEKPAALVRNTLTSSALGAAKDPEHPLRGALTGATGSLVGAGINYGGNALFRGQEAGFFSPGPSKGLEFDRTGYQPSGHSLLTDPPSSSSFGLRPDMSGPGLGDRFARAGVSAASRLGSGAASRAVGSSLTPSPTVQPPNPYESYGYTPYWMRH